MAVLTQRSELVTEADAILKKGGAFDASRMPVWITQAEDWLAQNLRIRAMETFHSLRLEGANALSSVAGSDTITATGATTVTAYAFGDRVTFTAAASNTGAVTINIDGAGAQGLQKMVGDAAAALVSGDVLIGQSYEAAYDGARFVLTPPGGIPLPSRFLALRRIYIAGDPFRRLRYLTPNNYWDKHVSSDTGKPKAYTIEGDFIVFGPRPDATYDIKVFYYRRFAALTATTDTNWVLSNARGLYLDGVLVYAYSHLGDVGKMTKHAALRDQLLKDVHGADQMDRHSGDALIAHSDVTAA